MLEKGKEEDECSRINKCVKNQPSLSYVKLSQMDGKKERVGRA